MPPSELAPSEPRRPPTAKDFPATGRFSLGAPAPRFAARAIDLSVIALPVLIVIAATTKVVAGQPEFHVPWWLLPATFVLGALHEFVWVALRGGTAGKWLFGLTVVRHLDGCRPTAAQALLRALVPWSVLARPLGMFAVPLFVLGYGLVPGELHRGAADHAAGTLVNTSR